MDGSPPETVLGLDRPVLDRFMPMHLVLSVTGVVESLGPTLAGVVPDLRPGDRFEDVFDVRSPGGAVTIADVLLRAGPRFRLVPKAGPRIGLRGVVMALPGGKRVLVNLSFGIDLIKAVREFGLTDADFAPTDLAMELLYLAEVNAAVTGELKGLNLRLDGARQAAEEEAMTDGLTGLKNRRAADLYLARLCAAGTPFGLLHIDLDFFKAVNDTLGHAAGDHVLGMVGAVLREQTRSEDCAARIGGDEFVVILPERTDPRLLQAIAERIIAGVSVPQSVDGRECRISASVGIVRSVDYPRPEPAMILADSDAALYAAKRAGRSRAVLSHQPA